MVVGYKIQYGLVVPDIYLYYRFIFDLVEIPVAFEERIGFHSHLNRFDSGFVEQMEEIEDVVLMRSGEENPAFALLVAFQRLEVKLKIFQLEGNIFLCFVRY